jgi:hypothetical protein
VAPGHSASNGGQLGIEMENHRYLACSARHGLPSLDLPRIGRLLSDPIASDVLPGVRRAFEENRHVLTLLGEHVAPLHDIGTLARDDHMRRIGVQFADEAGTDHSAITVRQIILNSAAEDIRDFLARVETSDQKLSHLRTFDRGQLSASFGRCPTMRDHRAPTRRSGLELRSVRDLLKSIDIACVTERLKPEGKVPLTTLEIREPTLVVEAWHRRVERT